MRTLTYDEAKWLVDFSKNTLGLRLQGKVVEDYYEAERLLRGLDKIDRRSCTCHYKSLAKMVSSLWDQYKQQVTEVYDNGPTKTKAKATRTKSTES